MLQVFLQIARNTFRECLREPVCLILLLASLTIIGLLPSFALFVFRQQIKMVVDSSMATMLMIGMTVAVICASNAIFREIRNGTALLILSKPVNRPLFILAKMAGICSVLVVFCGLSSMAVLMARRIAKDQFQIDMTIMTLLFSTIALSMVVGGFMNYITRRNFSESTTWCLITGIPVACAISWFLPQDGKAVGLHLQTATALLLVSLAVIAMGALSTALSTCFNFVANLTISFFLFMAGLLSPYFFGIAAREGSVIHGFFYAILPNWQEFWMADPLSSHTAIPAAYVTNCLIYFLEILAIFAVLAILIFQDRELGSGQER